MRQRPFSKLRRSQPKAAPTSTLPTITLAPAFALARVLNRLGVASRSQCERLVRSGAVSLRGQILIDPEQRVAQSDWSQLKVLDEPLAAKPSMRVAMLNKPRGLIVSACDERGRRTIYDATAPALPRALAPAGRLDQASEGLLLLCNDPAFAARITAPGRAIAKRYHLQVHPIPTPEQLAAMRSGVLEAGELLAVSTVQVLRQGERNAWLECELHEGRNRQLRRICQALGLAVLRLLRVAIGPLTLGTLAKGAWRDLTSDELAALTRALDLALDSALDDRHA